MDGSVVQVWMSDVLHGITQGLLLPDIVLLIAFIAYALFCIGSILVEFFTERRHFQVAMPKFLAALMAAEEDGIPPVIEESGLLARQKTALLTVYDYRMLPGDALVALIKRLVSEEESRYDRISGRNNMAARVSPMLGLMGTLIPLGPGIEALGKANTELLSASLLIAFDTTVAGLVVAAICMVVGKVRSIWYGNYMSALDSAMATMLEKIEEMRAEGKIVVKEPTDYAFLFEQEHAKKVESRPSLRRKEEHGQSPEPQGAQPAPLAQPVQTAQPAQPAQPAQQPQPAQPVPLASFQPAQAPASQEAAPVGQRVASGPNPTYNSTPVAQPAPAETGQGGDASPLPSVEPSASRDALKPLRDQAAFEPVPDPAFISDLAAAAQSDAAHVAEPQAGQVQPAPFAQQPVAGFEPLTVAPFNPLPATFAPTVDLGSIPAIAPEQAQSRAQANPVEPLANAFGQVPAVVPESIPEVAPLGGANAASAQHRSMNGWYQPRLRPDDDASRQFTPPQV